MMPRTDILERKEDILKWIEEKQSKAYICKQLHCKPETLNSYLEKMGIYYKGRQGLKENHNYKTAEEYAKKVELPTVPTKVSELQNDSEFIVKSVYDEKIAALEARIAALESKHPEAVE